MLRSLMQRSAGSLTLLNINTKKHDITTFLLAYIYIDQLTNIALLMKRK